MRADLANNLVPTNRIALHDVVLYGNRPREVLDDQLPERV